VRLLRRPSQPLSVVSLLAAASTAMILSGCGGVPASRAPAGASLQGAVHGGQPPVTGAVIQLYAAGADGYGSKAMPLLTKKVTTNSTGHFIITGDYTCPSASTQVYLVASGGNPGLAAGTDNAALAMMAALGPCGDLKPTTYVNITEVTTVASVYALAQFMGPGGGAYLGTSSSNEQGLSNAFATVNNLVNTATGIAPGPNLPAGATVPIGELNTLAGILAACINSDGSSGECGALFAAAVPDGETPPANTIDAVLDMALNPGHNVSTLYGLVSTSPPFQPTLGSAPNDWTLSVRYGESAGLIDPFWLAIDGSGNVWTGNLSGMNLGKFSNAGVPLAPKGGFSSGVETGSPYTIAIDNNDNLWAFSASSNELVKFSNDGTIVSVDGYTGGGLNFPFGIAVDGSDDVWLVNFVGNTLSEFSSSGIPITGSSGFAGGGLSQAQWGIAIDGAGSVWVAGAFALAKFSSDGSPLSPSAGYTGGGLYLPVHLGIDAAGNVWVANSSSLSEFSNNGDPISGPSGYTGGGMAAARALAVDGDGHIWMANGVETVSEFSNAGVPISPSAGFRGLGPSYSLGDAGIAVDSSGNVWVASEEFGTVTQLVGAAGPVVTPLAKAVRLNKLGARP